MTQKNDPDVLEEFKQLLQQYKSAHIPEANWRLHALLRRLGLTKYEIQAYITLVESGGNEQNVTQIVKKTGIPHPRAYDTLRNLVKYGLITPKTQIDKITEDQKRTAKSYRAFEPAIGLGNLFAYFTYAKEEAVKELEKLFISMTEFESGIWEILGRDNIINIINIMITKAKHEILISADVPFIQMLKDSLISASKRKVIISCVSNFEEGTDTDFFLEGLNFLRLRRRPSFPMPYIILDRSRAIQWNFKGFELHKPMDPEFVRAQVIDEIDLIDTLIDHFFFLNWRLGKPITVFRDTPLPSTFIHIVNMVEEIERLLNKSLTPQIVVKGKNAKIGEPILKVGRVSRLYKNWESGIFTIYIETDQGVELSVGGFGAIYEDIAADQITISL